MSPVTYRIRDRGLLLQLMEHPGRGVPYNARTLGEAANISRAMVGHLCTGVRQGCAPEIAHRIAEALGVGVLVLFVPPTGPSKSGKGVRHRKDHDGQRGTDAE